MTIQKVTLLGATGSIGDSSLDVMARHPDKYQLYALVAGHRVDAMLQRIEQFKPQVAVLTDTKSADQLRTIIKARGLNVRIEGGDQAAIQVSMDADTVIAAIVGAAGLAPTLAAAKKGKRILLANKEALVMAGPLFVQACKEAGATVLPLDSEHNAIFQCLPPLKTGATDHRALVPASLEGVSHLVLTASGGPFRNLTLEQMRVATPDQACAHPNWAMGRKISVDSATLMNKGLELIEACLLFGLADTKINIVVHKQSIIHSMVQYNDGSLLAQLGRPDMRTPIAHCLAWPSRHAGGVEPLDICQIARLDFEEPDQTRFACLKLARQAYRAGPAAPCVLNAANEIAVAAFLDGRIGFLNIAHLNETVLTQLGHTKTPSSIDEVIDIDSQARALAFEWILKAPAL
jgi:1-deoxy-D-xylulose-5-phosphate reductoisomerase